MFRRKKKQETPIDSDNKYESRILNRIQQGLDCKYDIVSDDPLYQEKMADSYLFYLMHQLSSELYEISSRMAIPILRASKDEAEETKILLRGCPGISNEGKAHISALFRDLLPIGQRLYPKIGNTQERRQDRFLNKDYYRVLKNASQFFLANKQEEYLRELETGFREDPESVKSCIEKSKFYNTADKHSFEYVLAKSLCVLSSGPLCRHPFVTAQISTEESLNKMRYKYFFVPKQNKNKLRLIAAPKTSLKLTQKRMVERLYEVSSFDKNILAYVPEKDYVKELSSRHLSKKYMMNFDIKNFFYTIDNSGNALRLSMSEMIKDITYATVRDPKKDFPGVLAQLLKRQVELFGYDSEALNVIALWETKTIDYINRVASAYIYKLCKVMLRVMFDTLDKAVNRNPFNKTLATDILFKLLTLMESIKTKQLLVTSPEAVDYITRPEQSQRSRIAITWLFVAPPEESTVRSNCFDNLFSYSDVLLIASTVSMCKFLVDIDKKLVLTPTVSPDAELYGSQPMRRFTRTQLCTEFFMKHSLLDIKYSSIPGLDTFSGNSQELFDLHSGKPVMQPLRCLYSKIERFCSANIPTKIDGVLNSLDLSEGSVIRRRLETEFKVDAVRDGKIDYTRLYHSPNFSYSKLLHMIKSFKKSGTLGWRVCVPQGAPTSGVMVNYLNRHLLEELREKLRSIKEIKDPDVYIYSDNIFLFYDLEPAYIGPNSLHAHSKVRNAVTQVCKDFSLPINRDKDGFFMGDKKLLGIIVDEEGTVRISRRQLREANQIIINLNKNSTVTYKGTTYTRSDLGRIKGLINWIKRGDNEKYVRKIIPMTFLGTN